MTGFDPKAIDLAFGPDAVPNLRRENARRLTQNNGDHPAWLRGLIARHGQPVTYQPDPLQLGDCWYQTWAWVGFGLQIEQGPSTWKVSAHRAGVRAKLAGLRAYPTEAQIADVIALAGLDDAPEVELPHDWEAYGGTRCGYCDAEPTPENRNAECPGCLPAPGYDSSRIFTNPSGFSFHRKRES